MREPGDEGGQLKAKQMDLTSQPIHNHLDDMLVSALMLTWQDAITFTLKEDLRLTGVTMTDILQAERDTVETNSKVEALDADFALMSLTFRKFLPQLISYLN
ncbi:recombination-associated protein RdgC [Endozoicomonas sp. SCSIO W0465]|nr:recombination-associated protein RdgC [Endozoicomonas sp. SCSIO W0465]